MKIFQVTLGLLFLVISSTCSFGQSSEVKNISSQDFHFYFDYDIARTSQLTHIDSLVSICNGAQDYRITISGHTDADGSDEYNRILSEKRSDFIFEQLQNAGLNSEWMKINSFGEEQPVAPNSDDKKHKNRRVLVQIKYRLEQAPPPKFSPTSGEWFYSDFKVKPQTFYVKGGNETIIQGKNGTLLSFPENAFCSSKNIRIELREYYDKASMIKANLSTTSNDEILESGGMIQVEAFEGDKAVELCKEITIMIPDKLGKEDMLLFDGHWDEAHNSIDWTSQGDPFAQNSRMRTFDPKDYVQYCEAGLWCKPPPQCRFFFCKIRRALSKKYDAQQAEAASNYSESIVRYRELRKKFGDEDIDCDKMLNELYADEIKRHGAKDYKDMVAIIQKKKEMNRDILEGTGEGDLVDYNPVALDQDINYLIHKTSNLGFINCDRFSDVKNKTNVNVPIGDSDGAVSAKLIFKKRSSIINGQNKGEKISFKNIPVGEVVTILVLKYVSGKVMMASEDYRVGDDSPTLNFRDYDADTFQSLIQ